MKIKIDRYVGESENYYFRNDDAFRGQHPDTRTDKEFLADLKKKTGIQDSRRWYPGQRGNPHRERKIFCITNGKTYGSVKELCNDLGLNFASTTSNIGKHLKRHPQYNSINGYEFLEVK